MIEKLVDFLNRPLPDGACFALGMIPPCYVCWTCIGVVGGIITAVVIFT